MITKHDQHLIDRVIGVQVKKYIFKFFYGDLIFIKKQIDF